MITKFDKIYDNSLKKKIDDALKNNLTIQTSD
jgi:hypothetical protein